MNLDKESGFYFSLNIKLFKVAVYLGGVLHEHALMIGKLSCHLTSSKLVSVYGVVIYYVPVCPFCLRMIL